MQKIFSCYSATSCSVAYLGFGGLRMENAAGGVGTAARKILKVMHFKAKIDGI